MQIPLKTVVAGAVLLLGAGLLLGWLVGRPATSVVTQPLVEPVVEAMGTARPATPPVAAQPAVEPPAPAAPPPVTLPSPPAAAVPPPPTAEQRAARLVRRSRLPSRDTARGVAVNPADPHDVLVWDNYLGLLRSRDAGASWESLGRRQGEIYNAQRHAFWAPAKGLVFVPGVGNKWLGWLSRDGGNTFSQQPCPWADRPGKPIGVYQRIMTPDGTLVAGWYDLQDAARTQPVFLIASRDAGVNWTEERQLDRSMTYSLFPAADGFAVVYATSNELFASVDGGRAFIASGTGLGGYNMGEPWFHDGVILHLSDQQGGPLLSLDAGARSWSGLALQAPVNEQGRIAVNAFAVDPRERRRVWLVGDKVGLIRTTDGGRTWRRFNQPLAARDATLDLIRGPEPKLAVAAGDEFLVIDDSAATDDLFSESVSPR